MIKGRLARALLLLLSVTVAGTLPAATPPAEPMPPAEPIPSPVADDDNAVRSEFMAAMQRLRAREPDINDSRALETYVIYDYLVAARLHRALKAGAVPDELIDAFIKTHAGQPVVHSLRHEWLISLAERGRWDWFLPRSTDVTDTQLVCDRLAGRLASGAVAGLETEALARWSLAQRQPAECNPVFSWLRTRGLLTAERAEERTRAALAADNGRLAADFVVDVPAPRAAALRQWIDLLEAPQTVVTALAFDPAAPVLPDALAAGFNKLSFSDSASASSLLPALLRRPDMTPALQTRLLRAAALGAAYGRAPNAIAAFNALGDVNDTQVQEWRVRAAVWAQDFATALRWIDGLPPSLAAQPRWRYWRARAVAVTAGADAAAPLYAQIAGLRDYYGYLAADKLGTSYDLNIHLSPDDSVAQSALAAEPGLMRAHALFECDMIDDAAAEWSQAMATAKPAIKVQAAHLASRWGWYAQTIATLAQAGEWDDVPLRYPRPYEQLVAEASESTAVPVDILFAIMRQESLFRKDAVSHADARGLMQMQPATATAVARRWHLTPPGRDGLFEPALAVKMGALYFRELLDKYSGQLDQSLAAYNAGPVSVARWQPPAALDADVWIENIPYTETRGYVQHILEHIVAFATVRNATPPRLTSLLPPVASAVQRVP